VSLDIVLKSEFLYFKGTSYMCMLWKKCFTHGCMFSSSKMVLYKFPVNLVHYVLYNSFVPIFLFNNVIALL
jgi:hypothetical protein